MKPQSLTPKKLLIGFAILIGIIVIWWLTTITLPRSYTASQTPFSSTSFSHLSGDFVYTYNGAVFYKVSTVNGSITTLMQGKKLPIPSQITWVGDKGAVMVFSSGFGYSTIEQKMNEVGIDLTRIDPSILTWYIDFATGDIQLVSQLPLSTGLAVYDPAKNGVYFVPNTNDPRIGDYETNDSGTGTVTVYFYDIAAKTSQPVKGNLKATNITYLSLCSDGSLCYIGNDTDGLQKLYSFKDNTVTVRVQASGRLEPTNNPDLFLVADQPDGTKNQEDVEMPDMPLYAYDVTTKQKTALSTKIANEGMAGYFHSVKDFYLIMTDTKNANSLTELRAGASTVFGQLKTTYKPLSVLQKNTLVGTPSYGNNGSFLSNTLTSTDILISQSPSKIPARAATSDVQQSVSKCISPHYGSYQYDDAVMKYTIFVPDDKLAAIPTITQCLLDEGTAKNMIGYSYYFGVTNSLTHRIMSD